VPERVVEVVRVAASIPLEAVDRSREARSELLARADRVIVTAGDGERLAEAALTGRPVALFDLPRWYDRVPVVRPLVQGVLTRFGGETYRGTPLQQHVVGRTLDWLTTRGLLYRRRDQEALYRSLEARGLVVRLGAEAPVAAPRPLDDLPRVVARVRDLLTEAPQPV
jgi:hypothetical protein